MTDLDILFVHPVVMRRGKPIHVLMPLGLFSLAHCVRKEGFETEILNMGVEKLLNPGFDLGKYVAERNVRIVGIDLHWYTHSYVAIEAARTVKENSDAFVVLGGFTSSCFAEEIIKEFPAIDAIIRGEAEGPIVDLVKKYIGNHDYSRVPNATLRKDGRIYQNDISFVAKDVDAFQNCELDLLRNAESYLNVSLLGDPAPYAVFDPNATKSFDLNLCRGCPYQCSYCGGGMEAQKAISKRDFVSFRSPEKALEEIFRLREMGVGNIRVEYVGHPEYYSNLFELVKRENLGLSCRLSLWNLPPRELLEKAHQAFSDVHVVISPDSGSEKVRRLNKGPYYSNQQVDRTMEILESKKTNVELYFTIGLPWEKTEDFEETVSFASRIVSERKNVANVFSFGATAEPGSPIFRNPEKYGVILGRKTFMDFYRFWERIEQGFRSDNLLGLDREDCYQESIVEMNKQFRLRIKEAMERRGHTSNS